MKKYLLFTVVILTTISNSAQDTHHSHQSNRKIEFPDIDGFKTLICDLHQHTVFSDGAVWPSIRVQEAIKDGIDVISLTEHLEYQPHEKDIPHKDRNRAYQIALDAAKNHDLIVINGSEITRSMPPGHSNAIFITDANKLLVDDAIDAFNEAHNQGAFVFWNHPNWISQVDNGIAKLTDMHKDLLKQNLIHGIEVVNEDTYSDEALQIALDNDLTIIGTSDIHGLIDWKFNISEGGHRPVTLVFAKEKNKNSLKEALFNKQTVVYFNNILIGRKEFLVPLITASINITKAKYIGESSVLFLSFKNNSDVDFMLKNNTNYTFHDNIDVIIIKANSSTIVRVKTLIKKSSLNLNFEVLNAVLAPNTHPNIDFKITIN